MYKAIRNFKTGHVTYKIGSVYMGDNVDMLLKENLIIKDVDFKEEVKEKPKSLNIENHPNTVEKVKIEIPKINKIKK